MRSSGRLLPLLHLLHLLRVPLLHALRLLLMLLLQLLHFRRSGILLRQLLMLDVLPLLEILPILVLLLDYLVLLLLVFFVQRRIPRVGGGALERRQVVRMSRDVRPDSRGNSRCGTVCRDSLLGVIVGSPRMLGLTGHRSNMSATRSRLFLRCSARIDP